jgi:hypothetical protein
MARRRLRMLEGQLDQRRRAGEERAGELEGRVDTRRQDFDARDFARETAQASFADFAEDHARGISDMRGSAVGMGRLRSGFADEDEQRFTQDMHGRLARELARGALHAGSLDLRNIEGMGGDATEARRGADAALAGSLDRAQAAENERQKRRRGLLGMLGAGAGALIGGSLGGPLGASVGARVGGMAGGS